jgi:hypothetical protein
MDYWSRDYLYELFVIEVNKAYGNYSNEVAQKLIDEDVSSLRERFNELLDGVVLAIPDTFSCYIDSVCSRVDPGQEPTQEISQCYDLKSNPIFSYWKVCPDDWRKELETFTPGNRITVPDGLRRELSLGYTYEDDLTIMKLAKKCAKSALPVIEAYKAAMLEIVAYPSTLPPDHDLDRIAKEYPEYLYPQDEKGYYLVRKSLMACFDDGLFKGISLRVLKKYIRKLNGGEFSPRTWKKYSNHDYI